MLQKTQKWCLCVKIIMLNKTCKHLCSSQNLFSVIIKNPVQKSPKLLVKETSAMLIPGFAYKKSSLHNFINLEICLNRLTFNVSLYRNSNST